MMRENWKTVIIPKDLHEQLLADSMASKKTIWEVIAAQIGWTDAQIEESRGKRGRKPAAQPQQ